MWCYALLSLLPALVSTSKVVELTDSTFDQYVTADEIWLLDFYAPWCGHCQRIAPILDTLSEDGILRIGKIDATENPQLKGKYDIASFPTLLFSNRGTPLREYRSGRTLTDFQQFQKRMTSEPTHPVTNRMEIESYFEESSILFLLVLSEPDTAISNTYLSIAQYFQHSDIFLIATTEIDSFSSTGIYKLEKGEPFIHYQYVKPISADHLSNWVENTRYPIFPQLSGKNFYEMANHGKKLVLVCTILKDSKAHQEMTDQLHSIARKTPEYAFGWLDALEFESFVSRFLVFPEDLPKVVVLDAPNERFYEREEMKLEEIEEFLSSIANENEPIRYQGVYGWPVRFPRFCKRWFPYSILLLIPLFIALYGLKWGYTLATTFDDDEVDQNTKKNQ